MSNIYDYIETKADEDGAYGIPVTFKDEYGDATTPLSVCFTVMDIDKNILNNNGGGNEEVTDTLSSSMNIKIPEGSLAIQTEEEDLEQTLRLVEIQATYDSELYGTTKRMGRNVCFDLQNRKSTKITIS